MKKAAKFNPFPKRSKFRNTKTEVDGILFDSKKESKRYSELKLLERACKITKLVVQRRFPLKVNGYVICTYIAPDRSATVFLDRALSPGIDQTIRSNVSSQL